jgi:hypothetical protein
MPERRAEQLDVADAEEPSAALQLALPPRGHRDWIMVGVARLGAATAVAPASVRAGTNTVRTPSAAYRANTPPVLLASTSGCVCTAINVNCSPDTVA